MNQVTTFTYLKVQGFQNKWWAFKQMQLGIKVLSVVDGLRFYKLLGSGGKKGFSSWPNFSTYVLVSVWDSEGKALDFQTNNDFYQSYQNKSVELFTVFAKNVESHGVWNGSQPFERSVKLTPEQPVMVLTRATIRFRKLLSFWRRVGQVSQSLEEYPGLATSIGVGEWPLIQQATISIWKTQSEMLDYAYTNVKHKEVVMLTRKLNWYKEELFARFLPYKFQGTWNGENMEELLRS
jgi:hypothetical protein